MTNTAPHEVTNPDLTYLYRALSVADIINSSFKRDKTALLRSLLDDDKYWVEELYKIAIEKTEERRRANREKNCRKAKRGRESRQARAQEAVSAELFMQPSSDEELLRCYTEAHNATSNASLEDQICAVCACLRRACEAGFTRVNVTDIPNSHKLAPYVRAPNQTLRQGCLLEPKGCQGEEPNLNAEICKECWDNLLEPNNNPPKHSLANNLWVGEVPWKLECLSFVELFLIALVYPRVFVMKLYPRDRNQRSLPKDQLQSALRGNVMSFELNSAAILDMIAGKLMPQPVSVLASTLSITFIGRGKIRDLSTLNMLRVQHKAIRKALEWLKENNKKYYGDIVIDESLLEALPENNVPPEVLGGIRYEEDESMAEGEYTGYAPESYFANNGDTEAVSLVEDTRGDEESDNADVIPIQYLGVMDNDLSKMRSDKLLRWGLHNLEGRIDDPEEPGYAI
ncbi:hypothetical protein FRC07_009215 [Ceratobasidium sp. 392]|nr:hypothetical protein FRC07_009215 [Ceratobasidium sp. 392]